jgi:hypothetical protein
MSEYVRTTRDCPVSQLHPELLQAIRNYFQEHELGDLESETLRCCQTISEKKNVGKLASWLSGKPDTTIYTGMIFTSQWLIWVHHGDKSGTLLNAANLNRIRAKYYPPLFTIDGGLEIVGYIGDADTRIRGYIEMGADLAAQKFCEEVRQASIRANPPSRKNLFNWPAG